MKCLRNKKILSTYHYWRLWLSQGVSLKPDESEGWPGSCIPSTCHEGGGRFRVSTGGRRGIQSKGTCDVAKFKRFPCRDGHVRWSDQ
jgi:hypothetical protein